MIKKACSKVANFILNWPVYIIGFVAYFLLTIVSQYYISNKNNLEDKLVKFLKYTLKFDIITLIFLVLLAIAVIVECIKRFNVNKANEIAKLEKEINYKDELLLTETGKLVEKFSDLQKYYDNEVLHKILKVFVDNNQYVQSAQLYKYFVNINKDNIIVKVNYTNGYASDAIDINTMLQNHYCIPKQTYLQYVKIMDMFNTLQSLFNKNEEERVMSDNKVIEMTERVLKTRLTQFISVNIKQLQGKKYEDLNEVDTAIFAVVEICISLYLNIECINDNEWDYSEKLEELTTELRKIKRTGILSSILKSGEHIFKNDGDSKIKKGRIYVSECFEINKEKCVIMLAISPEILDIPYWHGKVRNLSYKLVEILQDNLNMI